MPPTGIPPGIGGSLPKDRTSLAAHILIAALLALLFYPTLAWLVRSWLSDPYYTHGLLVPPIAALLAWRQVRQVRAEPRRRGGWMGTLVVAVSLVVAVWAMRWQDHVVASLALIALLVGLLLYLEGWSRLRHWLFPLLFLVFMVPLPFIDRASPWMESFAARWATALARLAGIEAAQRGGEISLPGTTLLVGATCSGLRSLVAMVTIGVGWVYLVEGRWWAKGIMLLAVVPLVVLSNVLRIAVLLVVAELLGEEAAMTYYHGWSSPVLFLMALGLLLLLGRMLRCHQLRADIF